MGIALPKTIVEGRNRTIVLTAYGLVFGGMLPALVGRWWFGNREKTKDGVNARSAAVFFKSLGEESGLDEVVASLGKSLEYERPQKNSKASELDELEKQIQTALGAKWSSLKSLAEIDPKQHEVRRRAFILLYAHLLRLPIQSSALRNGAFVIAQYTILLLTQYCHFRAGRYPAHDSCIVELAAEHCTVSQLALADACGDAAARVPHSGPVAR